MLSLLGEHCLSEDGKAVTKPELWILAITWHECIPPKIALQSLVICFQTEII